MAKVYGKQSDELSEHVKSSPISDLSVSEMIPAGIWLRPCFFLALAKGISDRVNREVLLRYESLNHLSEPGSQLAPCCLPKNGEANLKEPESSAEKVKLQPKDL